MNTALLSSEQKTTLLRLIDKASHVLLTVHKYPDYDAIGSLLSFSEALTTLGKPHTLWLDKPLPQQFNHFPTHTDVSTTFDEKQIDLIIALDCANLNRIEGVHHLETLLKTVPCINIDHHQDNSHFGTLNIVPRISSVGELLTTMFRELDWPISAAMADQLYTAITYDTGRFAYSSTLPETFRAAAYLVERGANPEKVADRADNTKSLKDLRRLHAALEHVKYEPSIKTIYTYIPITTADSDIKIVDVIRQHQESEIAIVFQEAVVNEIKINFRSKTDFNVSEFASQFGGGGHKKASGAMLEMTMEKAITTVIEALKKARA